MACQWDDDEPVGGRWWRRVGEREKEGQEREKSSKGKTKNRRRRKTKGKYLVEKTENVLSRLVNRTDNCHPYWGRRGKKVDKKRVL
jgi:hypothetical protein